MEKKEYVFGENSQLAKAAKIAACFGNNNIAKSEIGYAFSNSNPDMNSLKFSKKGEELKKMFSEKKEALQKQYNDIEVQRAAIKAKLIEAGFEFEQPLGSDYDRVKWDYNSTSEELRDLCYRYNETYVCQRLNQEIKTCQALIDNIEDKKTYNLSTPQLLSLQKAMEFDIIKGGVGSGKHKSELSSDDYTHKDFQPKSKEHLEAAVKKQYSSHKLSFQKQKVKEAMEKYKDHPALKESKIEKSEETSDLQKAYEVLGLGDMIRKEVNK